MASVVIAGDTSGTIALSAPAVAGTNTLTLPAVTDTLVGLAATQTLTNKSIAASQLTGTIAAARLPAGSVLQVVSAYKTDAQTISSNVPTFVDITGLSVTLTPTSSNSKFLCIWSISAGNGADASHGYFRLVRNGTDIALADTAGSRTSASSSVINTSVGGQTLTSSNTFLDSPATASAVTYKITASKNGAGANTFINRSSRDIDSANNDGRSTSSLTVMEIAG